MSRNSAYAWPGAVKIAAIGGGTGLSTMLRGLKTLSPALTAIVSMSDDGGGSRVLRRELGMPPPGDVRHCLEALANTEPTMATLLSYRFREGSLKGQSFGNLFLAALTDICGGFENAVLSLSEVLSITGRVLPVTEANVQLTAEFQDGAAVTGQIEVEAYKKSSQSPILRVDLIPERPAALPECLDAIRQADLILLGPGSLYTSVIPNLLVEGVAEAIHEAGGTKLYIMNLMTQDGETEGFSAADHVRALFDHGGDGLFDHCLCNDLPVPEEARESYLREGAVPLVADPEELGRLGVTAHFAPVADYSQGLVRHDPLRLAREIMAVYRQIAPTRTR